MDEASSFVHAITDDLVTRSAALGVRLDPKTELQEYCARLALDPPRYEVSESGPDHDKFFFAAVHINGEVVGRGEGTSKRLAEQQAAGAAARALDA